MASTIFFVGEKKYDIPVNSAHSASQGYEYHFGKWEDSFNIWKSRWGWTYQDVRDGFDTDRYKSTLIGDYFNHDTKKGPLKTYDLGDY